MSSSRGRPPRGNFLSGFRFAWTGLQDATRTQRNFRVHLGIASVVVLVAVWLRVSRWSWALLVLTIGSVLTAEVFNTAAELLVDLASPDYHPLAKRVKDLAAGAVLIAALVSILVGLLILGPPLWGRMGLP
jgi:diacylglycerol kinase